ncbi:hypothetical protein SNEBB_005365 [Seison nebaliae]|nr:hypothetical protein SNEBB_005365 [Seison nebaliae]
MSEIKLLYFNFRGRAEVIRLMLHMSKVEFEDKRFTNFQEWQDNKEGIPEGNLPILQIDGKDLKNGMAVVKYLARKYNLYGETNEEKYKIDYITENIIDLYQTFAVQNIPKAVLFYGPEHEETKELIKGFVDATLNTWLPMMDKELGEGDQYLVNNKMSFADLMFYEALVTLSILDPKILEKFSKLTKFQEFFASHENLKDYLEKRPSTLI